MKLINKRFLLGEELPSGATVSIKIEVFDNGDELFITYPPVASVYTCDF